MRPMPRSELEDEFAAKDSAHTVAELAELAAFLAEGDRNAVNIVLEFARIEMVGEVENLDADSALELLPEDRDFQPFGHLQV